MGACCHSESVEVQSDASRANAAAINTRSAGLTASAWLKFGLLTMAAGLVMSLALAVNLDPPVGAARSIIHSILASLTLLCLLLLGWPIFRRAFRLSVTLELLFLIGLLGTFSASVYSSVTGTGHIYYEVVLVLLAIYRFGQLISARQTANLRDLTSAIPGLRGKARVMRDGTLSLQEISQVKTGDRIIVRPGETVPIDGGIHKGHAYLEELAHSGEPFPVPKSPGATVLAGSRVLDGEIELEASTDGTHRELDRLHSAIADNTVTAVESLAQKVLNFFVPSVVIISLLTFLLWWLILKDLDRAIFNALAVTIVACPCGLGLAIPLAAKRGMFSIRLLGIEAKRGDFLDRLAAVDHVVFDKTGTLSQPRLTIRELHKTAAAPACLESWLSAVQHRSTHPVARPFWELAEPASLDKLQVHAIPARGVRATFKVDDTTHTLTIGNYHLRNELAAEKLTCCAAREAERKLFVYLDDQAVAEATLTENPRESAVRTLQDLRKRELSIEVMTGDSSIPDFFRDQVDEVHLSLTSEAKGALVQQQQHQGKRILYVGDGQNDAEAMQSASASIGLSSGGSIVTHTTDAVLDHDDLSVLAQAIDIARSVRAKLQRLLFLVLIYNFIGISMAVAGILHPVVAAFLMLASSATVLSRAASVAVAPSNSHQLLAAGNTNDK